MQRHFSDNYAPHRPSRLGPGNGTQNPHRGTVSMPTSPIARRTDVGWEGTVISPFWDGGDYAVQPHSAGDFLAVPESGLTDTPHPLLLSHQLDEYDSSFPSSSLSALTPPTSTPPFSAPLQPDPNHRGGSPTVQPKYDQETDDGTARKKRAQVRIACTNCQRACKKCSNTRPCERCEKFGMADCVDSARRPRKTGVKRGPYKRRSSKYDPTALHAPFFAQSFPPPPRSPSPSALPPGPRSAALQSALSAALSGPRWNNGQRHPSHHSSAQNPTWSFGSFHPEPGLNDHGMESLADGGGAGVLLPRTPMAVFPMSLGVGGREDPFSRAVSPIHGVMGGAMGGALRGPMGGAIGVPVAADHLNQVGQVAQGNHSTSMLGNLDFGRGAERENNKQQNHHQQQQQQQQQQLPTERTTALHLHTHPFSDSASSTSSQPLYPRPAPPSETQPAHWLTSSSLNPIFYPQKLNQERLSTAQSKYQPSQQFHPSPHLHHPQYLQNPHGIQPPVPPHPTRQPIHPDLPEQHPSSHLSSQSQRPNPNRPSLAISDMSVFPRSPEMKALRRIRKPSILTLVGPGSRPGSPVAGDGTGLGASIGAGSGSVALSPGLGIEYQKQSSGKWSGRSTGMGQCGGSTFRGAAGIAEGDAGRGRGGREEAGIRTIVVSGAGGTVGSKAGTRATGTDSPTLFDQPMVLDDVEMDWAGGGGAVGMDVRAGVDGSGIGSGRGIGASRGSYGGHGGHGGGSGNDGFAQDISAWRKGSMDAVGPGLGLGFDGMIPFQR